LVLVHPGIHVNTAWAFSAMVRVPTNNPDALVRVPTDQQSVPTNHPKPIAQIIQQPIATWRAELHNDFELPVFEAHPEMADIKAQLYQQQALYAAMSGSGSTVFGIFPKEQTLDFEFPAHYFVKTLPL
jgi:4-diphosphocytidyl-2-C-methyl-D-erythritol kinase